MYVDYGSERISPLAGRKLSLSQHGSDPFSNGPVSSFCNTILVGFLLKLVLEVEALALSESNTVRARGLC